MPSDTPAPPEAAADIELLCAWSNVRKLKALGLTISHDTGYTLTSLGARVLREGAHDGVTHESVVMSAALRRPVQAQPG